MRSSFVAVLALTGLALADSDVMAQRGRGRPDQSAARNGWLFSLSEGKRLAGMTGKPLMVVMRCQP